ncbi:DUF5368 family protein [Pararhizobium sp. IMCC21322]|nr:DUF5368 family protein [Pararhizobium sp. IMCC21322]
MDDAPHILQSFHQKASVQIRDRAMSMRKFLWAQLAMPFGAIGFLPAL